MPQRDCVARVDRDQRLQRVGAVPPAELRAGDDPFVLVEPVLRCAADCVLCASSHVAERLRAIGERHLVERLLLGARHDEGGRTGLGPARGVGGLGGRASAPASAAAVAVVVGRGRRWASSRQVVAAAASSRPESSWSCGWSPRRFGLRGAVVGPPGRSDCRRGRRAERGARRTARCPPRRRACLYEPLRFSVKVTRGAPVSMTRVPAAGDWVTTMFAA